MKIWDAISGGWARERRDCAIDSLGLVIDMVVSGFDAIVL